MGKCVKSEASYVLITKGGPSKNSDMNRNQWSAAPSPNLMSFSRRPSPIYQDNSNFVFETAEKVLYCSGARYDIAIVLCAIEFQLEFLRDCCNLPIREFNHPCSVRSSACAGAFCMVISTPLHPQRPHRQEPLGERQAMLGSHERGPGLDICS